MLHAFVRGFALALIAASAGAVLARSASSVGADPSTVIVEDWSRQPEGRTGVPDGWKGQSWGNPRYDFTVLADGPGRALRLRSRHDNSTISKEVRIDVRQFPRLTWRWKVVTLPAGADSRRKETDDQAAQLYLTFPRVPAALRSRTIGYVWDTTAPAGTVVKSEAGRGVTYVIVRSGPADLGRWIVESRDVRDDFRWIYGEEPGEDVRVLSLAIDSNDTRSTAEAYVGEILFRRF